VPEMIRDTIRRMVILAAAALAEQELIELPPEGIPAFEVDRPKKAELGDYSTNLAMKLARPPKAREIAKLIADYLNESARTIPAFDLVARVEVAGPGFINLYLHNEWLLRQARTIYKAGANFGNIDIGSGTKLNLEFVSANPTGPVHIGNGRGGFIGDTLGNVLRAAGYTVTKEYYFNDFGQQLRKLGRSMAWYIQGADPEQRPTEAAYFDNPEELPYYQPIADKIRSEQDVEPLLALPTEERDAILGHIAAQYIMADIKKTMARLNINFDVWFNQASLDETGELQAGINALRERGFLYEQDGATWMKTIEFGDDKDRVVIKADGEPTYIASDVAYALNKLNRGFDRLIYVLGPDHHGYVARLKATARMFGYSADQVHVLMYQQVNLKVDGLSKKMSKRAGNMVTLDDLAEAVGSDITRFFYLMRDSDTHLDFDMTLALKQGDDNPGLSVQYGHARIAGILRKATEAGYHPEEDAMKADLSVLVNDPPEQLEAELALMRELTRLEEVIERCALDLAPHHLTKYGMDVASSFHIFYDRCPMLRADTDEIRSARYALTLAARTTLAKVLTLLGMSAPDRM